MKHEKTNELLVESVRNRLGFDIRYTRRRTKDVILAKACVINVLNKYYGANTVQIGKLYRLHHSTVIHHIRMHGSRFRQEDDYCNMYNNLVQECVDNEMRAPQVEETIQLIRSAMST